MRRILLSLICIANLSLVAQDLKVPTLSPITTISQEVGLTDVTLTYSRPSAKGRAVFGGLVPFDEIWRTGANKASTITFSEDVIIAGNDLPAGSYAIYSIPGAFKWTMIIHKNTSHRSLDGRYDENEDAFRFEAIPTDNPTYVETFTMTFSDIQTDKLNLSLSWENTTIKFPIKFEVDAQIESQMNALLQNPEQIKAGTYFKAAEYYLHNQKDLNVALDWINAALTKAPKNPRFGLLKAKIHMAREESDQALSTVKSANQWAIEAKNDNYIGQTGLLLETLEKDFKLVGRWYSFGSVFDNEIVDPNSDIKMRRFDFDADETVRIASHQFEKGKAYKYRMNSTSTFDINNEAYEILHDGGDSLVVRFMNQRMILLSEERFFSSRESEVYPQLDAQVGLYQYFFDSRSDLDKIENSNFAYDLIFLANEPNVTIRLVFDINEDGSVSNVITRSNYPDADEKFKAKAIGTSGKWNIPEGSTYPVKIDLTFKKPGEESKESIALADENFQRGMTAVEKERSDRALFNFNEAIKLNPSKGIYYYYRGLILFEYDNAKRGCQDMETAIRYGVDSAFDKIEEHCN